MRWRMKVLRVAMAESRLECRTQSLDAFEELVYGKVFKFQHEHPGQHSQAGNNV